MVRGRQSLKKEKGMNLRLRIPLLVFSFFLSLEAKSADLQCFSGEEGRNVLLRYLLKECKRYFERRRREVKAIETRDQVLERQKKLKRLWRKALGDFPQRSPLRAKTVSVLGRENYTIEKVLYESWPDHHVTANLYLPRKDSPPFPGVLVPCGHSHNGKACEAYQRICISLALHGFVVLCYDPIGQGERYQTLDQNGKPLTGGTREHTLIDIGARLVGRSTAFYRIWDGIRSLDYLISRKEVDGKRIGCTGNSGGGTMTSYLMVTDPRIYAAAVSLCIPLKETGRCVK